MIPNSLRNKHGHIAYAQMREHGFWAKRNLIQWKEEQLEKFDCSDIRLAVWLLANGYDAIIHCSVCDTPLSFDRRDRKFCSVACARKDDKWRKTISAINTENAKERICKAKQTNLERYGVEYTFQSEEQKSKTKQTNMERYGVSNVSQNHEIHNKQLHTNLERYGVEYTFQSEDHKAKAKQTNIERYGTEYVTQSDYFKRKAAESNIARYGVEYAVASQEVRDKISCTNMQKYGGVSPFSSSDVQFTAKQTMKTRYGVSHSSQIAMGAESIAKLQDRNWLSDQYESKTVDQITAELNCDTTTVYTYLDMHGIRARGNRSSDWQRILASKIPGAISEASIFENKYKKVDIFVPDHNLVVECNGVYWHSELYRDSMYHKNRKDEVNSLGYRLLQFNDLDWAVKEDVIISIINNSLGKTNRKIYARQCSMIEVSPNIAKQFIQNNHLMGANIGSIRLGLEYCGELVSVMTFGKPNYNKKHDWELLRFCSSINTTVVGGASRLLSSFRRNYNGSIISYSDNMISDGGVYQTLGFAKASDVPPTYYYYKPGHKQLMHRSLARRDKLPSLLKCFDPQLSERENMKANGWLRYYDAGKIAWIAL